MIFSCEVFFASVCLFPDKMAYQILIKAGFYLHILKGGIIKVSSMRFIPSASRFIEEGSSSLALTPFSNKVTDNRVQQ